MKRTFPFKPLGLALAGLLMAAPAFAVELDFSGSDIYMKFLDGDRRVADDQPANTPGGSGDTASNTDQGQWTEFELHIKATLSRQVEAGVRLQSRSSTGFWTDYGGFGDQDLTPTRANYTKARGAYVLLTPGYAWLDQALIGASDWGMFDPFTVGKLRYIDRDNVKGFYLKGPVVGGGTWQTARISLPNYLQFNYGQGPACCSTDDSQFNEAVYVGQFRQPIGPATITASYQFFNDHTLVPDIEPQDGAGESVFFKNQVYMVKGNATVMDGLDVRAAYYHSKVGVTKPALGEPWGPSPRSDKDDDAIKLDVDYTVPVEGNLAFNFQYFDLGAGYYSNLAARREADVLLTEGSEAAWYRWGDPIWLGGAAADYQQGAATPHCFTSAGGRCVSDFGLAAGANGLVDNSLIDFDEPATESALGWKGGTVVARYEPFSTPMSLEVTMIDYGYNTQNRPVDDPLTNFYPTSVDRKTDIYVFKVGHVFPVLGGLETNFKAKWVSDSENGDATTAADDLDVKDRGYSATIGNQLFADVFGSVGYGRYTRDITFGTASVDNKKSIYTARAVYNLTGFELGTIAQWIEGNGDPYYSGTTIDVSQYRLKAYVKVTF